MRRLLGDAAKRALAAAGIEARRNRFVDPVRLAAHHLSTEAPTIVDVGAYTGETWARCRARWPGATLHAVEPFPDSAARLRERVSGDARTTVHELALGAAEATATLHVNLSEATNSVQPFAAGAGRTWGTERLTTSREIEVPQRTLDALAAEHGIERVHLLKVDVQGAEYAVFEGARGLLSRGAIDLVLTEHILARTYASQRPLGEYLALFERHGYELLDVVEPIRRDGRMLQCDLLFGRSPTP